jgi:flagellar biogenesis protein FliO
MINPFVDTPNNTENTSHEFKSKIIITKMFKMFKLIILVIYFINNIKRDKCMDHLS